MVLAQQGQLLRVALLERGEQPGAEAAHLGGQLQRLLDEHRRAHRAHRLVQAAHHAAQIEPGRRRLDQHARVDRRIEQRHELDLAVDVLAVADLGEAVLDGVPVAEQLRVGWHAEVEAAAHAEQRSGLVSPAARRRRDVERELALEVDEGVTQLVEARVLEIAVGLGSLRAGRRDLLRLGPEQVGGEHVAERGLVDRLDRHLREQAVAPGDQVVEVLHHDEVLERDRPGTSRGERRERAREAHVVAGEDVLLLLGHVRVAGGVGVAQEREQGGQVEAGRGLRGSTGSARPGRPWRSGRRRSGTTSAPR